MIKETKKVVAGSFIEFLLELENNFKEGWQVDPLDYPISIGSYFETTMIRYQEEQVNEETANDSTPATEATEDVIPSKFAYEPETTASSVSAETTKQRKPYTRR